MKQRLDDLLANGREAINAAADESALQEVRVRLIGKKVN